MSERVNPFQECVLGYPSRTESGHFCFSMSLNWGDFVTAALETRDTILKFRQRGCTQVWDGILGKLPWPCEAWKTHVLCSRKLDTLLLGSCLGNNLNTIETMLCDGLHFTFMWKISIYINLLERLLMSRQFWKVSAIETPWSAILGVLGAWKLFISSTNHCFCSDQELDFQSLQTLAIRERTHWACVEREAPMKAKRFTRIWSHDLCPHTHPQLCCRPPSLWPRLSASPPFPNHTLLPSIPATCEQRFLSTMKMWPRLLKTWFA